MVINGFTFGKLDILKRNINDPVLGIPVKYGIYKWVYWPEFDDNSINHLDLIDLLISFSEKNFCIEEELKGTYKFRAKIWEQGYKENNNMFGLSDNKHRELMDFFTDRDNIKFFSQFFKEVCFSRPFYLGKANNLNQRLGQHFKGLTNVQNEITAQGIPEKDIWVGHKELPLFTANSSINTIFEEIYSRALKPGLSIKPN